MLTKNVLDNAKLAALLQEMQDEKSLLLQEIESKHQLELKKIQEINSTFEEILTALNKSKRIQPFLADSYNELLVVMNNFEVELCRGKNNFDFAISTAKKLLETTKEVLDDSTKLDKKLHSIAQFEQFSRNARFSKGTKIIIGSVIGELVAVGLLIGILAATGLLIPSLIFFPLPFIVAASIGAFVGVKIASHFSKDQNDARGAAVSEKLNKLSEAKHRFFRSNPAGITVNNQVDKSNHDQTKQFAMT